MVGVIFQGGSNSDNVEEWRWRLGMLLKNEREQEIVTRERKDRREFDQLSQLADRMGLYWYSLSLSLSLSLTPSLIPKWTVPV